MKNSSYRTKNNNYILTGSETKCSLLLYLTNAPENNNNKVGLYSVLIRFQSLESIFDKYYYFIIIIIIKLLLLIEKNSVL